MHFVYKYIERKTNEVLYVGETENIENRHSSHKAKDWYNEGIDLYYEIVKDKDYALLYESYLILKHNPVCNRNKQDVKGSWLKLENKVGPEVIEFKEKEASEEEDMFLSSLTKIKDSMIAVYYDEYKILSIRFKDIDRAQAKSMSYPRYFGAVYYPEKLELVVKIESNLFENCRVIKTVIELFGIDKMNLDMEEGVKAEGKRIQELSEFMEELINSDYKIKLKKYSSGRTVSFSVNHLLSDLKSLQNSGIGYSELNLGGKKIALLNYNSEDGYRDPRCSMDGIRDSVLHNLVNKYAKSDIYDYVNESDVYVLKYVRFKSGAVIILPGMPNYHLSLKDILEECRVLKN